MNASHMIDWSKTAAEIQDDYSAVCRQRDELLAEFAAYKEGSEEAFGTVVSQKQAAEARLQTMQSTIASQQGLICDFRKQRDELLEALIKARYDMAWAIVTLAIEREPTQREIEKAIAISTPDSDIGAISKAIASAKGGAA